MKTLLTVLVLLTLLSACSIKQVVEPAEIPAESSLCIIENPDVREGFLATFETVLNEKKVSYRVVDESNVPTNCEWTATYVGNWRWDLALYMAYAEIKIFHNGSLDGEAIYDSKMGGANMSKFIDAETKIRELLNELMQLKTSSLFSRFYS
jgi:hypothetical protein